MTERMLARVWGVWNGERRMGIEICCADCEKKFFYCQGGSRPSSSGAINHFRSLGWRIGNGPRMDRCPACVAKKTSSPQGARVIPMVKPNASIEPPRVMGRDDRRLVFAKIDEVYLGEGRGYSPEWSDEAVAKDLNVPRAWITTVRDEMFGPAISEEAPQRLAEQAREYGAQLAEVATKLKDDEARITANLATVAKLNAGIADLMKVAANLSKVAGAR